MMSFFPTSKSGKESLPVSTTTTAAATPILLRRRLSCSSLTSSTNNETSSFPFSGRSKSFSFSFSIRNWWDWSWAWILSRKPIFATDLEINEQETKLLGSRDKGSWKHIFYRMRSEIRRITNSDYCTPLPQTYTATTKH